MDFLATLIRQNDDLSRRYNLNIVVLVDGLKAKDNDYLCPYLDFYKMPSYLALVRYFPAAMSVFINALPNIKFSLYVAPTSSLQIAKGKVGIENPILLTNSRLFPDIQKNISTALGAKKYQKHFRLSDYWSFQTQETFLQIDKSFCLYADNLIDNAAYKTELTQKILFFVNNKAIIPHHCAYENYISPFPVRKFIDVSTLHNKANFSLFESYIDTKKLYMTTPTAYYMNEYRPVQDEETLHSAFEKAQQKSTDGIVKTYITQEDWAQKKLIKVHTVGQKILPIGYECIFKPNKKTGNLHIQQKNKPFFLDMKMLRSALFYHEHLKTFHSVYQTYYLIDNPKNPQRYSLHKTVSSDGLGYTKIAMEMEKNSKRLKKMMRHLPTHIESLIDIHPINHLVYIPLFNQFMRQKNAFHIAQAHHTLTDTLSHGANDYNKFQSGI